MEYLGGGSALDLVSYQINYIYIYIYIYIYTIKNLGIDRLLC